MTDIGLSDVAGTFDASSRRPRRGRSALFWRIAVAAAFLATWHYAVEAKLIERLIARDERAFNELVTAYGRRVSALVLRMLGNKAEEAFRQSMLLSQGELSIFWSNPLVGSIMGLGLLMLLWPAISAIKDRVAPRSAAA